MALVRELRTTLPMIDTIPSKGIIYAQVTATQLDAAAVAFPRVVSSGNEYSRAYQSGNERYELIVKHTPRTDKNLIQRSSVVLKCTFTRVDALSQPLSQETAQASFNIAFPASVTSVEVKDKIVRRLLGTLLEGASAGTSMIDQVLNLEA